MLYEENGSIGIPAYIRLLQSVHDVRPRSLNDNVGRTTPNFLCICCLWPVAVAHCMATLECTADDVN